MNDINYKHQWACYSQLCVKQCPLYCTYYWPNLNTHQIGYQVYIYFNCSQVTITSGEFCHGSQVLSKLQSGETLLLYNCSGNSCATPNLWYCSREADYSVLLGSYFKWMYISWCMSVLILHNIHTVMHSTHKDMAFMYSLIFLMGYGYFFIYFCFVLTFTDEWLGCGFFNDSVYFHALIFFFLRVLE